MTYNPVDGIDIRVLLGSNGLYQIQQAVYEQAGGRTSRTAQGRISEDLGVELWSVRQEHQSLTEACVAAFCLASSENMRIRSVDTGGLSPTSTAVLRAKAALALVTL